MNVLVVLDHPRRNSFCGAVADALMAGLASSGHKTELADLRREGFDPRLPVEDEPDWGDADKVYSKAVLAEQTRIARNDALAFVFPIWWWSFPATTKGWIDRVWNNGWAYGEGKDGQRRLKHQSALLIGAASADQASYAKRGYEQAMQVQLVTGIMDYCGIPRAELKLLYDVMAGDEMRVGYLAEVRKLGARWFESVETATNDRLQPR